MLINLVSCKEVIIIEKEIYEQPEFFCSICGQLFEIQEDANNHCRDDRGAPDKVTNFVATYSISGQKIILSWVNPKNNDFAGLILSYGFQNCPSTEIQLEKSVTSYEIENIKPENHVYLVSLVSKDSEGNLSEAVTDLVCAVNGAVVKSISLNRTHLDTIMKNRDIEVSMKGSNYNQNTSISVFVTDGTTDETPVNAIISWTENTVTATISAPVPLSPIDEDKIYTVKVIVDGELQKNVSADFIVSKPACITSIELDKSQINLNNQEKVTATIKGINFDIRGVTKICLLGVYPNNGVIKTTKLVPLELNLSDKEFITELTLPNTSGCYAVAVYFDDVKSSITKTLEVFEDVYITKVSVPKACISYGGNKLPVNIYGKNFTSYRVGAGGFKGSNLRNCKIVNDALATAEIICPSIEGEIPFTVNYDKVSATCTLSVKDYSTYEVGDLLLRDGSFVKYSDHIDGNITFTDEQKSKAIGVVCGKNIYNAPLILGLKQNENSLQWTPANKYGYKLDFLEIECSVSGSRYVDDTTLFSGDTDGSDNWEYIKTVDTKGTSEENVAIDYQVFNYANTYGVNNNLPEGYKDGWYVPSLAELAELYRNKYVVNKVLKALGTNNAMVIKDIGYNSSSQYNIRNYEIWYINFRNGNINFSDKSWPGYVLVVRVAN